MKQVNEGGRITVGKRDHVGVDTEELLRRIQIAKSAAGDNKFRWLRQNDPAEVLTKRTFSRLMLQEQGGGKSSS